MLLAVSNSSDPTAGWKAPQFTGNAGFADFPTLSVDSNAVYVGTNNFTSDVGSLSGVSLFSIPKSDLTGATPTVANRSSFENLSANTVGFTLQAVRNFGPSAQGTILAVDNVSFGVLDRTNVIGPGGAGATLSSTTKINVASTSFPSAASQPDGTRQIDTGDDRFSSQVIQVGNTIYMVHSVNSGARASIRWTMLNATTNAVIQEGTISGTNTDYFFPSIAVNANGDVVIGYSRSGTGAGQFISSYARVGKITNGVLTFGGSDILLKSGVANYHLFGGAGERWGDYSATVADPTDSSSFWSFQEYAEAGNVWSTQITQIKINPVPAPPVTVVCGIGMVVFAGIRRRTRRAA